MPVKAILATGDLLVGGGVRSFESVIMDLIRAARSEIQIAAYSFDLSFVSVLEELSHIGKTGVRITIVTRAISTQHPKVQTALKRLAEDQRVVEFPDSPTGRLHMKVLVIDRNSAIVGSANFTMGGLISNHELGVWLTGQEAWQIGSLLDRLVV
ncbi:MAG: phospholipase D family protein [Candidatus Hadarchaeales archaeon]